MIGLLRKGILLYILLLVAGGHWLATHRTTSWRETLWVVVYPINGDGSARSARYIDGLARNAFAPIATFVAEEARHHGVTMKEPMRVVLGPPVAEQPPAPPRDGGVLSIMLWSLRLRYWAWSLEHAAGAPPADIEVFVRYFDPDLQPSLAHSLGLQKGRIGVVNAFASRPQVGSNQVIIAHEILHTLGATDKYHPGTGHPTFPHGYAEPHASPRYPQNLAELMGGRIPLSAGESLIPRSLEQVIIGDATAMEIRWR